eukprot:2889553-Rhodomonas_salina.1
MSAHSFAHVAVAPSCALPWHELLCAAMSRTAGPVCGPGTDDERRVSDSARDGACGRACSSSTRSLPADSSDIVAVCVGNLQTHAPDGAADRRACRETRPRWQRYHPPIEDGSLLACAL